MNKNILIGIGGIVVFPSPYGVSFILILSDNDINCYCEEASFRLLTEYHSFLYNDTRNNQNSRDRSVSVSLRSIIHSYFGVELLIKIV